MAATVSAWSKPGAWALDSEQHEDELTHESAAAATPTADFPSLAAAASTKTKKKKPQTFSLGDFQTADQKKFQVNKGLTVDEQIMLPTGPRQRTAEEMNETRGFRSYGSDSSRWGSDRGEEGGGGRGGGGRFGRDRERDSGRDDAPSRADEIDDWGAAKKSSVGGGFERRERGERSERGGFFSDSQSRADDSDSWVSNKSFTPSSDGGRRYGGGFDRERRGGFESNGNGADSDNWGRKKEEDGRRVGTGGGGAFDSLREKRGGNETNGGASDAENWGKRREDGIGTGTGTGSVSARPKLNLQPRKLPVGETEEAPVAAKSSKGSNPFGDARPREQVLKEKGQDWKEIDEKLESSKIKEADGPTFGKRGFGVGNGRVGGDEERTWRKNENVDARPPSAQNSESEVTESGVTEETEEREPEI